MKTYSERCEDVLNKAEKKRRTRKRIITGTAIGLCAALLVTGNVALFAPYPSQKQNVNRYKDSEYYSLICQINDLTYQPPVYKNNFEKLLDSLSSVKGGEDYADAPASGDSNSAAESYEEVTINQTDGVIEGDLFKRSSEYLYYLSSDSRTLHIYSIEGENSCEKGSITLQAEEGAKFLPYYDTKEMYLSADCGTVTVVTECYYGGERRTAIIPIDVSDPENAVQLPTQYVSGSYVSSRMVDGDLLIINNFYVNGYPDFSDRTEYIPSCGDAEGMQTFSMDEIVAPDNATAAKYTVICRYDTQENEFTDKIALFSYLDEAYVSADNIFVLRSYYESIYRDDGQTTYVVASNIKTEISCVSYSDGGLTYINSATIDGNVKDRYCMDEYEGVLRVFATTTMTIKDGEYTYYNSSASLFCIDLESFEIFAKVENFAPSGDTVQSARFDKEKAYVCTAIEHILTDPVYSFDLSDYNNITYNDSGIISGYSTSLITFKDNTLLGIGYGDNRLMLKIELYDADTALSVTKHEENAQFSTEFKSYYINSKEGLVGLAISHEGDPNVKGWANDYLLLRYDGYELVPVLMQELETYTKCEQVRATLIDGYFYIMNDDEFIVSSI